MNIKYTWDAKKGAYSRREGKIDEGNSTERRANHEKASPDGAMAAESIAPGSGGGDYKAPQPGADSNDASARHISESAHGDSSVGHGTGAGHGSDDRRADESHAGAPPRVEIFEEDRAIHVDFDDMLDIARRTRVSGDGNKP